MKLGIGHYGHKSIPDAKFESGSSSSFGDMTSQNFPSKKGTISLYLLYTIRIHDEVYTGVKQHISLVP